MPDLRIYNKKVMQLYCNIIMLILVSALTSSETQLTYDNKGSSLVMGGKQQLIGNSTIINTTSQWQVLKSSGTEKDLVFWALNSKDKKTEIGWIPINNNCEGWIDKQIYDRSNNLILDDKNKPIALKCETAKCNGQNCYHISLTNAQSVNIDDYIRLGNQSSIIIYQDLKMIRYNFEIVNFSVAIQKNVSGTFQTQISDIFVFNRGGTYKFGANDSSNSDIAQYKYIINSTSKFSKDAFSIKTPFNNNYLSIDFSDICSKKNISNTGVNANCVFNVSSNKKFIGVVFYSDKNIDPTIQLVSSYLIEDMLYQDASLNDGTLNKWNDGSIPLKTAVIINATLIYNITAVTGTPDNDVTVWKVTNNWTEGSPAGDIDSLTKSLGTNLTLSSIADDTSTQIDVTKFVNNSYTQDSYYYSMEEADYRAVRRNLSLKIEDPDFYVGATATTGSPLRIGSDGTTDISFEDAENSQGSGITPILEINYNLISPFANFSNPTYANNTYTANTYVPINISITNLSTPSQIKFNWNGTNYSLFDDSLRLYMNFDNVEALGEYSGDGVWWGFIRDITNNNHNGIHGATSYFSFSSTAKYGTALKVHSVNPNEDYVQIFDNGYGNRNFSDIDTDSITISYWCKPSVNNKQVCSVQKFDGFNSGWIVLRHTDNKWLWQASDGVAGWAGYDVRSNVTKSNQWYHIVATHNTTEHKLYVNGNLIGSASGGALTHWIGGSISVGGTDSTTTEYIDELAIWNRALSQDEIRKFYFLNLKKHDVDKYSIQFNGLGINSTSGLAQGTYTYYVWVNNSEGDTSQTETRTVTVTTVPYFTNLNTSPYSYGLAGDSTNFSATANDNIQVNTCGIEHNFNTVSLEEKQITQYAPITLYANYPKGQHFTFDNSVILNKIGFYMSKIGTPTSDLTVNIYATSGNNPIGSSLASAVIPQTSVSTSLGWVSADFATSYTVSAGTKYVIVASSNTLFATRYVIRYANANPYRSTDYRMIYSSNNGAIWGTFPNYDMAFNITGGVLGFLNTTKTIVNAQSGNISYNISTKYSSATPFQYRYWCNDTDKQYGYSPTSGYYNFYVYPAGSSDTVFPTGNIISPENGTSHSGTVTLDGNASDNNAISYVYYQISGLSSYLDPVSNGTTNQWNATAKPNYAEIDDGIREPNAPDTGNYIYSTVNGQIDEYNMSDTSETGLTVSKISVWVNCDGQGAGDDVTANIYVDGAWNTSVAVGCPASTEWRSANFTGSWDETDLNNLVVRLTSVFATTQATDYAMYVKVEYENYATLSGCDYITSTDYDCPWNTNNYEDGKQYKIKIVPVDSYGNANTTTTPIYLTVDNSIPYDAKTVTYPEGQTYAKNGDILNFTVTGLTDGDGGAGLDVASIYLNASQLNTSRRQVNFTYISGLNETGGQSNWYTTVRLFNSTTSSQTLVPFRASDLTSPPNTWKTNFIVKIDNDNPYYNSTEWNITWGVIYTGTNVTIQLHVYDNNNMSYFFNFSSNFSSSWTNTSYNYTSASPDTYAIVSNVLTTGTYGYYFTIFDNARNSNTTTINNITILGEEPEINITLIAPVDGANITTSGNITFYYNYTSTNSVNASSCYININGAVNLTNFSAIAEVTHNFIINFTVNGTNGWEINCNNTDGVLYLSGSREFNVTIAPYEEGAETTSPTVTLNFPEDNYVNDTAKYTYFNCTATDTSGIANISLYLTNSTNQSFSLNATNTSSMTLNTFNITYNMSNGNYTWNCLAYDTLGNYGFATANRSILINYTAPTIDTTPPTWSDNKTYPTSPTTYINNQLYFFNVTWNDNIAISTVIIEHNFTGVKSNYTVTNNYTYQDIGAGYYSWKEYANDTSNNWNMTDDWIYIINKATPSGSLTSSAGWAVTYGTPTTIGYSESNLGDTDLTYKIYRNGTDVGAGIINLSVGSYHHILNTSGGLNYTNHSSLDTQTLTVSQAQAKTSLIFNTTSPQTYGAVITSNCSIILGAGTPTLTRNGTTITSGDPINLGVGSWLFNCSLAETQNYTAGYNSSVFIINPSGDICNMLFNETSPLTYPQKFKAYTDCTSNYTLYRNGTTIINNSEQSLSAGTYNFSVSRTDTINYSNYFQQQTFIINKASSTCSIASNTPQTYSAQIQVNGTCSNPETIITLLRNNTDVTSENGTFVTLGAGYYFYNISKQETQNYTFANATTYVTINQNSSIVYLYLNGSRNNLSAYNTSTINITGILNTGVGNIQLYQNGTLSNSGASPLTNLSNFSVGYYNMTIKSLDTQNYTANFETWFLNISTEPTQDIIPPTYTDFVNNASTVTKINGVVNWSITLSDNIGLSSYIFAHNQSGSLTNSTPNVAVSGASAFVNTTLTITLTRNNYICGQYWFNDTSNNVNQTLLTDSGACFTVANSIPTTPTIIYPVDGNNYTNVPYINYSSSDADSDIITYKIYINNTLNISTTVNVTQWNASDGYYSMNISATDGTDSSANASTIYFTLDSTAPTVNIIYPTNGLNISSNSIYLNASAFDTRATSLTYYWVINGTLNTTTINSNSTFNASDGYYNLTLKVSDGLQNGSATIYFTLDTTPPSFSNNQDNSTSITPKYNDVVQLNLTVTDNLIGLSSYVLSHNDTGSFVNTTIRYISGATHKAIENITIANLKRGGVLGWKIQANDTLNNIAISSIYTVEIKNTAPTTPTIVYPVNNSNYTSVTQLNYSSSDADGDAITYNSYINNTLNITSNLNVSSWNISEGYYKLDVSANDSEFSSNATIYFTIDNTAPIISSLRNTSTTNQSSYIEWSCNEQCNYSISWYNSTALVNTINNNTFATSHNPYIDNLSNSTTYFINLTVWDSLGNSAINKTFNFTTTITIVTIEPTSSPSSTGKTDRDLVLYAPICGDKICDYSVENASICAEDCIITSFLESKERFKLSKIILSFGIMFMIMLVILTSIIYIVLKRKKKNEQSNM